MYRMRKVFYVVICLMIAGIFVVTAIGFESANANFDTTIVYLGDSICEGILGSSPFSERDSNCYYAIIGRRNNFRYVDKSVSGDTTKNMYNRLIKTDTPSLERQYWVSQADIIHVSILGNDFLGGNIGQTAIEVLLEEYTNLNTIRDTASQYFALSIQRIKELNPDALLLVNSVYNPLDAETTLLTSSQKSEFLDYANDDRTKFRTVGGELLDFLNSIIYDYLEQNPDAYEVIDVYTAFDNVYNEDYEEGVALIYGDWLHPSNQGHALMANLIQAKLEELELANNKYAVSKYKTLRIQQLERLFGDTEVDTASAKSAIKSADTCEEISDIYFDAINGVVPKYTNKPITRHRGKTFKQTKIFNLSSIAMGNKELPSSFIDNENSNVTYKSDGTFSIKLVPDGVAIGMVNLLLYTELKNKGLDVSEYLSIPANFGTTIEVYIQEVFPGFDLREFKNSVELLTSVGVHINGFDYSSEGMIELMNSLRENMEIPAGFLLPNDLSIEIKGYYFVEQAGDFTNIHMCVGNVSRNGYPFLYATLHTEENGDEWIETSIEVSKITLFAGR